MANLRKQMNGSKIICILTIFFISQNLISQELEGIYISSKVRTITQYEQNRFLDDTSLVLKNEKIDTTFKQEYILLDFLPDNKLYFKYIGNKGEDGTYKLNNGEVKIKTRTINFNGSFTKNGDLLFSRQKTDDLIEEIFFTKISETNSTDNLLLNKGKIFGTNWKINADSNSTIFGTNLYFTDTTYLIINQINNNWAYTDWAKYIIDNYKEHVFLGFLDDRLMNEYVFHVTELDENEMKADHFEWSHFSDTIPIYKKIRLIKVPLISQEQQNQLKDKMFGIWKSTNYMQIEQLNIRYDSILDANYYLELKDNYAFNIKIEGVALKDDKECKLSEKIHGKWEVSKTSDFIMLHSVDDATEFLTIHRIDKDNLEFYMSAKILGEIGYVETLMKFEKE